MTSALAVAAAMMSGSQAAPLEYVLHPPTGSGNMLAHATLRTVRRAKGRVAQNQRQVRKDRRRAHAAGVRGVFA